MSHRHHRAAVHDALARAHRTHDVFLQVTHARAAREAETAPGGGRLAGVPFAVKDVFDVRGTRTSAASQVFDHRPPARRDAEAVRRLAAAGAVLIGKTTMSELAYSGIGVNERFGTPTISRTGGAHVVGGSSSGSAAAVRAGVVGFALASDTSGSGRIPAAWSGLFGFRPSLRRYPSIGMTPLAPTLDTVAILAADLERVERADRLLAREPARPVDVPVPVFVVPHDAYLGGCDRDVLDRFHADLTRLRSAGHRVVQRHIGALDIARTLHRLHVPIVESEAFAGFGGYLGQPGLLSTPVRRRLGRARARLREHSSRALYAAMSTLRRQFARELGDAVLLSPPVEIDAPAYEDVRASPEYHDHANRRSLAAPMILSYLDAPSLVIPTGDAAADPPSSLQLSGSTGQDGRVLRAARPLTAALTARRPPAPGPSKENDHA